MNRSQVGAAARMAGKRFELRVRHQLESEGWIVSKWNNNINLLTNVMEACKPKWNPFTRKIVMFSGGFPDFIAFKRLSDNTYRVIGVESKMNGKLSKEEERKIELYIGKNIFNYIMIAKKDEFEHIQFEVKK